MPNFLDYIKHGWKLVPLAVGDKATKQTSWNEEHLALSQPEDVEGVTSAGLAHAYSGTCALDIDDIKAAKDHMLQFGIDLRELYTAPDAVRILSGRKNRAKLIYRLDTPLRSLKVIEEIDGKKQNIIDFRCATAAGKTVQDALPPSIHPITGKPYYWSYGDELVGDWNSLPVLPDSVREFWELRIQERDDIVHEDKEEFSPQELTELLKDLDPDEDYNEWLHIGMALHDATGGSSEGLDIWDTWSASGDKYKGRKDLFPHWNSMKGDGITVDYLLMQQTASPEVFDVVTNDGKSKPKKEPRFTPIHVEDWVQRPPPTWLIHGVLPQADLAMMFGEPGSGKSFLAMDIAMAIATNLSWREKNTDNGKVLWVAAEAAGSVRNRALAYAKHNKIHLDESEFWIVGDNTPNLSNVDDVKELAAVTHEMKPLLIVIDTMVAASGGSNENSGEDMGIVLAACRALHKVSGALVLLIHHSGKDKAKGARGWSGLKGAMQTEIEVTQDETGQRCGKVIKQRDGEQDAEYDFRLVPVSLLDVEGVPQTSCAVELVEGVVLADVSIDPMWIQLTYHQFLIADSYDINKNRFMTSILRDGEKAHEDDEELNEASELLPEHITDTGSFLCSTNEISYLGIEPDNEEF